MTDRIKRFREAIAMLERDRTGRMRELTRELRARAVAIAQERQAAGESIGEIADVLGLNRYTLRLWLRKAKVPILRRVRVSKTHPPDQEEEGPRPVVITPGGFRVEGLTLETVAQLLRRLP